MRDTKRLQLLELPCVILCFSVEGDYQRNIYVTNVCIETKSCRYEKKRLANAILLSTDQKHTSVNLTAFITAITDPSRLSALLFPVNFSTAWHPAHKREKARFPGERWDPRSELPNYQNTKSGPKIWIKPGIKLDKTWNLFVLYNKKIKIYGKNACLFQISPLWQTRK